MGFDLSKATIKELFFLILKRFIYLFAKFVSFKGAAFIISCIFCVYDIISGAVWCSVIIGIITNRTGKQVIDNHFAKKTNL